MCDGRVGLAPAFGLLCVLLNYSAISSLNRAVLDIMELREWSLITGRGVSTKREGGGSEVKINLKSKKKVHMKKDFTSKTKILNSPLYRGLKPWDLLPSDMQKDIHVFKNRLATHTFQ